MVAAAGLRMFERMDETNDLQEKLHANTAYFVERMLAAGFDIKPTESAICAVMLYDAKLSQEMAAELLCEGIYVTGFYYPVVPKDQARIRVQISAAHEKEHLDQCIEAFVKVGRKLHILNA
jgi:glycine C-acetyltransferase